jgi:VIT1/CCC1 family predicted Fe2+/Mn2+ transporter
MDMLDPAIEEPILSAQQNEITEYYIYEALSQKTKNSHNQKILKTLADDERTHYNFWKEYTHKDVAPSTYKIWKYTIISRILGLTFSMKLMEKGEEKAQKTYERIAEHIPAARTIIEDEDKHENELINLIDEERLKYVGSIVLGLNDALVELTGALAGFTLAFQNTQVIAMTGLITGIAASLSMAASEYLSTTSEESSRSPARAAVYTGSAYVITVIVLIAPFILLEHAYISLGITLFNALLIISAFTYYISVARDIPFRKRFLEMAFISLGIAGLTFFIGFLIQAFFSGDVTTLHQ